MILLAFNWELFFREGGEGVFGKVLLCCFVARVGDVKHGSDLFFKVFFIHLLYLILDSLLLFYVTKDKI